MNVLLLGDTHGNKTWVKEAIKVAQTYECTKILQLGDFGYWEHRANGHWFLESVSKHCVAAGIQFVWIDGNHENHQYLRMRYSPGGRLHDPVDSFWRIRPNLLHAPRGARWTWEGVNFLAIGGAYSIDKDYRLEGESWWPEETITYAEAKKCIDDGPVDVMVSHDAPMMAPNVIDLNWREDKDMFPESKGNRKLLQAIVDEISPQLVVHGHYHRRNSVTINKATVRVEGFSCDRMKGSMGILTLPELKVETVV